MTLLIRHPTAWIAASAAILGSAVPGSAETYLTESQALAAILGDGAIVHREDHPLEATLRAKLEHDTNLKFPEPNCTVFVAGQSGQPQKYAVVMNEIGKTEPITFMVGITDQGKVSDVVIMVFRENRGWEVKEKRFLNQFRGKTLRNPIRVEEDIINYTGATLSSKAVARGVKRALALVNALYLSNKGHSAKFNASPNATFTRSDSAPPLISVVTTAGLTSLYRQARYAMGTICEVRLWCGSAQEAQSLFVGAFDEIERLEQVFSAHREDSELAHVNREAAHQPVRVSDDFFSLTRYAIRAWRETGGLSDITIGSLQDAWRLRTDQPRQPSSGEVAAALALVGCDKIRLDRRAQTIRLRNSGIHLDFGGIAKGYAAQLVARLLHDRGAHAALVNLGRSSISTTVPNLVDTENRVEQETSVPFAHWLVGVSSPMGDERAQAYLFLQPNENLSTSGTSERQVQIAGLQEKVSHILNPRTGFPLTSRRSVTAITDSGARSEALAKQLLIDPDSEKTLPASTDSQPEEWLALSQFNGDQLNITSSMRRDVRKAT